MIIISLEGQVKTKPRVEQFIHDCFNHYFDARLKRRVYVEIQFKDKLDGDVAGYCSGDTDGVLIEISKDYKDEEELCQNLAHEIVHAKQYIRGEVKDEEEIWRKGGKIEDWTGSAYRALPWEREAYRQEKKLLKLYY